MIEPAELVLAYVSRIVGDSSGVASRPNTFGNQQIHIQVGLGSHIRRNCSVFRPLSPDVAGSGPKPVAQPL